MRILRGVEDVVVVVAVSLDYGEGTGLGKKLITSAGAVGPKFPDAASAGDPQRGAPLPRVGGAIRERTVAFAVSVTP